MKKAVLIAGLAAASLSAFADAGEMRIGAISWDCSVPASTFFGSYQTRSLGPEKTRKSQREGSLYFAPDEKESIRLERTGGCIGMSVRIGGETRALWFDESGRRVSFGHRNRSALGRLLDWFRSL